MVQDITHVIMAFMHSSAFNVPGATEWPLFSTVEEARSRFAPGTAIMIAIGGWGDTEGFSKAAATDSSRKLFAQNIKKMVREMGADGIFISIRNGFMQYSGLIDHTGVDIDWEYPG
jgi:GH18 family chitinase